jgi:hypothetical protein
MYKFEEFVQVLSTESNIFSIHYMDLAPNVEVENTGVAYPELKISPMVKYAELLSYNVSARLDKDALSYSVVDVLEMIKKTLEREMGLSAQKEMIGKISELSRISRIKNLSKFKKFLFDRFGYLEKKKIKDIDSIGLVLKSISSKISSSTRRGHGNFVICSVGMGSNLQDSKSFIHSNFERVDDGGLGSLYKIGTINGLLVYIDPYMKYNDNRVIVGKTTRIQDPGLYLIKGNKEFLENSDPIRLSTDLILKGKRAFVEVGDNVSSFYMEVEFTRGYSFFKYVLEKIGIIKKKNEDLFR